MPVFFNEIHYDNTGTDIGEGIEIAGTAGTDLTGWTIVLYNGAPASRSTYATINLSGIISDQGNGFGTLNFNGPAGGIQNGGTGGVEPDGFALVNASGQVVQFLSYEGSFVAANGPAAGMTSTNIGVMEDGPVPAAGLSLQLQGTGSQYSDFTWVAGTAASAGAINAGQTFAAAAVPGVLSINNVSVLEGNSGTTAMTFTISRANGSAGAVSVDYAIALGTATADDLAAGTPLSGTVNFTAGQTSATITLQIAGDTTIEPNESLSVTISNPTGGATIGTATGTGTITNDDSPPPTVFINEIHYDNSGTDVGEAVEIAGTAGTSLAGWSLVFYNGGNGQSYATVALSGVIGDQDDGYGTLSFAGPAGGIQNGAPDGIALVSPTGVVQFLSYEGAFVATNGPALGLMSTDIGVAEEPAPGAGFSLQLVGTGSSYDDFTWRGAADDNFGTVNVGQDFLSPNQPGQLRILDTSVSEGDSGETLVTVTVRRAGGTTLNATADYAIVLDGTANAADLGAGVVMSGSISFAPGVTQQSITFTVAGDTIAERNETLSVNLSNATGATIVDGSATVTIRNDDPINLHIYEIQGEGHISEYITQIVTTQGVVTAIDTNGYYIQDAAGDGNARTSDAIFVLTGTAPTVAIGDLAQVTGIVNEVRPGNNADNLSITTLAQSAVSVVSSGHALPNTIIGTGGINPPTHVFDDDGFTVYDPQHDAADFYESLEGMRVTVDAPLVVSATNSYNETWVVASGGAHATGVNSRGGITISDSDNDGLYPDMNPERIQLDDDSGMFTGYAPNYTQGDILSSVTGIMTYDFQSYQLSVTEAVTITQDVGPLSREQTSITNSPDTLTIATYNVENLDPGDNKFNILADDIVYGLGAPDIIGLQEIQDGDGAGTGSNLSGYVTAQGLIDAIAAIGGPNYVYIEITPTTANSTGGEPNGNIRNGFLYNADRVHYVDGSAQLITGTAFNGSRNPLVVGFEFNNQIVTAISVHSTSRGGSDPLFGANQPPLNAGDGARTAQSQAISAYVFDLLAGDPGRNIAVMGDFNAFYFEHSLTLLEQGGLTNVLRLLPEEERYTYLFEGNSQNLDNMLVTGGLYAGAMADVVHRNAEQPATSARGTDHDPIVASFIIPVSINGTPAPDVLIGTNYRDVINGLDSDDFLAGLAGNDVINGGAGNDILIGDAGADQMTGGAGDDTYYVDQAGDIVIENTGEGNDTVYSSIDYTLADTLENLALIGAAVSGTGNMADNLLVGNDANNVLNGLGGNDTIYGGAGDDTLNGDDGGDMLIGGDGMDFLSGGAGNDALDGGDGMDILNGGDGDDVLIGGAGADQMAGGAGNDTYYIDTSGDWVTEGSDGGIDLVYASDTYTLGNNIEALALTGTATTGTGNDLDNLLVGNGSDNFLYGLGGNDTIYGGDGADALYGGDGGDMLLGNAGNDQLRGEAGDDALDGGDGNDVINGGVGNDVLIGGAGADHFVFASGDGIDTVYDFTRGSDVIDLSTFGLTFEQLQTLFVQTDSNGQIHLASGDIIVLNNVTMADLGASDFVL